jgi:acyl-CoA dehydrogenase
MSSLVSVLVVVATGLVLAFNGASATVSIAVLSVLLLAAKLVGFVGTGGLIFGAIVLGTSFVLLAVKPIRQKVLSTPILGIFRKIMPPMSDTEKAAIEAGDVTWEAQVFSGKPDWSELHKIERTELSADEQAFIDGPCEELCRMIKGYEIVTQNEVPDDIMDFIFEHGFLGMIIEKKYGGLEFSERAHSEVLLKVGTVSVTVGVIIAVPNSLGPGKLLRYYGTEEQKDHYLPRLAKGKEIPCFGLTSPHAGSDATSIPDFGIVKKGLFDGEETLGIELTWSKRYITLAPISTVLGLAFQLSDPDGLLGDKSKQDYGITCALIPTGLEGVNIGRRQLPCGAPFYNGTTSADKLFVPLSYIIGGADNAGKGWQMLVEQLSVGRAISLPTSGTGAARISALTSGAYARIRRQFGLPIAEFEGVGEALTQATGRAYMTEASRVFTLSLIDKLHSKPAVASAILKYHATHMGQQATIYAMDIQAGKAVMTGPKNMIADAYMSSPVNITVEGANILTRNMLVYGQGAIRCHPWVLKEMQSLDIEGKEGVVAFDEALWSHLGFAICNASRSLVHGLTSSHLASSSDGEMRRYYQHFSRYSAVLALLSDSAMFTLGGDLKFREKLSARLGDLLSYVYIGSAVLKHWEDQGRQEEDRPLVEWCCQWLLHELQLAADGVLKNLPARPVAWLLRGLVFPLGQRFDAPSDALGGKLATLISMPSGTRDRIAENLFVATDSGYEPGLCYQAMAEAVRVEPLERKVLKAEKEGKIGFVFASQVEEAVAAGVITKAEGDDLQKVRELVFSVIETDDFDPRDISDKPSKYSALPELKK